MRGIDFDEAFGGLAIYFYLCWLFKRRRYEGQIFFHGVACYSVLRFLVEGLRGDDVRGLLFGGWLSTSQIVSLCLLPIALGGMRYFSKRAAA